MAEWTEWTAGAKPGLFWEQQEGQGGYNPVIKERMPRNEVRE